MITKIEFAGQSKATVAKVAIEAESGDSPEDILAKAKELYTKAEEYALTMTMQRNR